MFGKIKNKYINDKIVCINNNWTNDHLITIGKIYNVITDKSKQYPIVCIMTDIGILCHLSLIYFNSLSEIRKEKLNKLNQCLK